jgi:hypothetical protein
MNFVSDEAVKKHLSCYNCFSSQMPLNTLSHIAVVTQIAVFTKNMSPEEVEVNLRQTVSRPVCLGVRRPSGTRDQFFFLLEIPFRHLSVCYFAAPSLTRGQVCNLLVQLLLDLARVVTLESKSRRIHDHILPSHLRLPKPEGPGSRIYIPQEQGGPVIPPGTGFPFRRLLLLAGTTVEVF